MKLKTRLATAFLAALMLVGMLPFAALSVSAADDTTLLSEFSAMTYNVKVNVANSSQYSLINTRSPDIVGLQEVTALTYSSFKNGISGYTGVQGSVRSTGGEYNPIFYKTSKFTLVDSGTFWLSDTPSSVSKYDESEYYRICTWALLKVTGTSSPEEYVFAMNTHLDYGPSYTYVATMKQVKVLMNQMASLEASLKSEHGISGTAVFGTIITGDFNVPTTHAAIKYLTGTGNMAIDGTSYTNTDTATRFAHTRSMTSNVIKNTYNGDGSYPYATVFSDNYSKYISEFDHIFATTKFIDCSLHEVVDDYHQGDHLPVYAEFQLKQSVDSAKFSLLNVDEEDSSFSFYKDGASEPQTFTTLNCAPTANNIDSTLKFMVDSTQSNSLTTYIDKIEIFNGGQDAVAFTPFALNLSGNVPESGGSSELPSYTFTSFTTTTPQWESPMSSAADPTSSNSAMSNWTNASFSGGVATFQSASGNTAGVTMGTKESSANSTGRLGTNTSAFTVDVTAKFENLPDVGSSYTPSSSNYGGQVGVFFDVAVPKAVRKFSSSEYGLTASWLSRKSYPTELYISILRSERGSTNAMIVNLYGNRNGLSSYSNVNIEYQLCNIDFDNFHRYTFTVNTGASAGSRVKAYCDGELLATFTDCMYRNSTTFYQDILNIGLNMRGYATDDGAPAVASVDRVATYNGALTTMTDTSTFHNLVAQGVEALNSGAYPNTAELEMVLDAIKTNYDDGYNGSYTTDMFTTGSNATLLSEWTAALQTALENLESSSGSNLDWTGLAAALEDVDALDSGDFTSDSWADLQDVLSQLDYTVTEQSVVDGWTTAINTAIGNLVPNPELDNPDLIWRETFAGATSLPDTLKVHSTYGHNYGMSFDSGYWVYNLAIPSSGYLGDVKIISGVSQLGDDTGVTVDFYACFDSLPTLPGTGGGKAPYRGVQMDLYLAGVDKQLCLGMNAMTAAEKTANPGCDAWISLFNVTRGGAVVSLPVYLGIGDGMVHKYTFNYDVTKVRDLTGNVFGIYTDSACTNLVDTLNVSAPISTSNDLPIYNTPLDTASGLRTYYIKQLAAADGYLLNKSVLSYTMSTSVVDTTVYLNNALLSDAPVYSLRGAPLFGAAYSGLYDGASHNAITSVTEQKPDRVTVSYSTNGTSYSSAMPTVKNPGTTTVYAKAVDTQGVYADTVFTLEAYIDYLLSVAINGANAGNISYSTGSASGTLSAATGYVPVANGATVTLTANGSGFLFWKNARNDRQITTDATLAYPVGSQMDLVAVYEESASATVYTVIFKDSHTGKVYQTIEKSAGVTLASGDLPTATPVLYGYDFDGWTVNGKAAVGTAINADTTVLATYNRDAMESHTLTVVDGSTTTTYSRPFGKIVSLTAASSGFSYWMLGDTVLTTKTTVNFGMPDEDVTLTAVYGQTAPTSPLVNVVSAAVNEEGSFAAIFARDIPDTVEFVESGILMTRKAAPSDLYVGTTVLSVTKGVSTADIDQDCYGFQKDMNGLSGTWYIRGYMVYYNEGGELSYAYTDVYALSVAEGAAAFATVYAD